VRTLVAKGVLGPGAFDVDHCAPACAELSGRGVTFLSEPAGRLRRLKTASWGWACPRGPGWRPRARPRLARVVRRPSCLLSSRC